MTPDGNPSIQSRLADRTHFRPSPDLVDQANAVDPERDGRFDEEHPDRSGEDAKLVDWDERRDTVLDGSNPPCHGWFTGGTPNVSYNRIGRHLDD